jgi:hypothetical protein
MVKMKAQLEDEPQEGNEGSRSEGRVVLTGKDPRLKDRLKD